MKEKSQVEKVSSSLPVNVAVNAFGIYGATITPLAAFVPFLVQTLLVEDRRSGLRKCLKS